LSCGKLPVQAQPTVSTSVSEIQNETCPTFSARDDDEPSGPEITIAEVNFSGVSEMPISDQDQIAAFIKRESPGDTLDGVIDYAVERVRAAWQDHGYFKVLVDGDARMLTSGPDSQRIALSFEVEEGLQYRLDRITFKNNKAFRDVELLRGLFPIKKGEVFSREKIAIGLESLRKAYGELGYVNFTSIPDTELDDVNRLASLDIDFDEGKQFHFTSINVLGLDEPSGQELLKDLPVGQVYDYRVLEEFLQKHPSIFKFTLDEAGHRIQELFDTKAGTVAVTLDARPCAVD
jgi:outer membrane protein assembly factor BamA